MALRARRRLLNPDYFVHAEHLSGDCVATQCAHVGVAVLSVEDAQHPRPQDVNYLGCVGTAVAQGAALKPVVKQAAGLEEFGKEGYLAHGAGFALSAPLHFKYSSGGLYPRTLFERWRASLNGFFAGLASRRLCKLRFTHLVAPQIIR